MNNLMKRCGTVLFLALLLFLSAKRAVSAETWQNVGAAEFTAGGAEYISMAIDSHGAHYVAYKDNANSGKASVMKFDGLTWTQVGTAGFTGGTAGIGGISIALDSADTPYIAYQKPTSNIASVMKFTGVAWVQVGLASITDGAANGLRIAIDGSNVPYIAFQDAYNGTYKASVMKFAGGAWAQVGNAEFTTGQADYISLAIDGSGTPYVAYEDWANGTGKASVMKYDSGTSSWVQVGSAEFTAGRADYISLAIDGSGTPYVAYQDYSDPNYSSKASVMKYDSGTSSWVQVGSAEFTAGQAGDISLAIDGGGIPYVAYKELDSWPYKASVMKFDSGTSSWTQVGNAGLNPYEASYISLAIDGNGTPYVAYKDYSYPNYSSRASVMRFGAKAGTLWQQVGDAAFTAGGADYISMAIDSHGAHYVAYKDNANSGKASVMKFDSGTSSWTQVGVAGFTGGTAGIGGISIALDSADTPYIAYQKPTSNIASVMKFTGVAWVQVGATSITDGAATGLRIAIDGSDVPYIAFRDEFNGTNKASVMKFVGGAWAQVGSAEFTAGQADYISLAIDGSGTPYIAYRDWANGTGKASVMKYDSGTSSWVQVGSAEFTAGQADYISLAIDGSGTPHVAYQDYSNPNYSYKASVMKYDSGTSSWVQVGNAEFTPSYANYISLAIDGSGTPHVAYQDAANGYEASVMKYVPNPCGTGRALPASTWLMTAPSCQPAPVWINGQYGDDLGGSYDTTWTSFKWTAGAYVRQKGTDSLVPGIGNWTYSTNAGTLQLNGVATPTVDCTAYGLAGQCVAVDLPLPPAGQSVWSLAGHPFPYAVDWANVKIAANNGGWTVYSPSAAETAGYVRKTYQMWNGSSYEVKDDNTPSMIGTLQSQEAFWVRIMPGASALSGLKLLIPAAQ